ncbi:MAG: ATP-binding protein [Planctomycetes bacterium]|nr:ATP-binding protein [Planctomycetota bacterium]
MTEHEVVFPADGMMLRDVRAKVRKIAADLGAAANVCDNVALVVDEVVNNAIEHGASYRQHVHHLTVRLERDHENLVVQFFDPEMPDDEVGDLAQALGAASNGMPSLDSERGRGLFLLSVYLEGLRAELAPGGGLRLLGHLARQ